VRRPRACLIHDVDLAESAKQGNDNVQLDALATANPRPAYSLATHSLANTKRWQRIGWQGNGKPELPPGPGGQLLLLLNYGKPLQTTANHCKPLQTIANP
jgi:hypothetical protein